MTKITKIYCNRSISPAQIKSGLLMLLKKSVLFIILLINTIGFLQAQTRGGMVQGTITEIRYTKETIDLKDTATGAIKPTLATIRKTMPIVGAWVKVKGTPYKTQTDTAGFYFMSGLPRGLIDIEYSAKGFKSDVFKNVFVKNDTISEIDILLRRVISSAEETTSFVNRCESPIRYISGKVHTLTNWQNHPQNKRLEGILTEQIPELNVKNNRIFTRTHDGFGGHSGARTFVLMDNQRLETPVQSRAPIWMIDPQLLQQIDFSYGAQSGLIGSGAGAGLLYLMPKQTFQNNTQVSLFGGVSTSAPNSNWETLQEGFATQKGFKVSNAHNWNKTSLYNSVERNMNQSYLAKNQTDDWRAQSLAQYQFSAGNRLSLFGAYYQKNEELFPAWQSYEKATSNSYSAIKPSTQAQWLVRPKLNVQLSKLSQMELGLGYMKTKTSDFYGTDFDGDQQLLQAQFMFDFGYGYHLLGGMEAYRNGLSSDDFGDHEDMVGALYIQNENPVIGDIRVTYGARFDLYSLDQGKLSGEFNPKVGFVFPTGLTSTFRASYNSGFRLPSLYERYATITGQGFAIEPNADLENEYMSTTEFGYNFNYIQPIDVFGALELSDIILDANFYYTSLSQEVILGEIAAGQFSYVNGEDGNIWGIELSAGFSMLKERLSLAVNYHYAHPDEALTYRSHHQAGVLARYTRNPYWLALSYRYQSGYSKTSNAVTALYAQNGSQDAEKSLGANIVDIEIGLELMQHVTLSLEANNLLNQEWLVSPAKLGRFREVKLNADVRF